MSVTDIVYRINADSTRFSREMRFAAKDMRRLERRAESSFRKIGRAAGIMGGAVVTAFGAMVKRSIDAAAEMDEMAAKSGTATETLSELEHVAEENDVQFGTLQGRLQRLNREIAEAAREADEGQTSFSDFNVELRDSEGRVRDNIDVFADIADEVASAGTQFEKTAIATEFFGNRAGQELLPILEDGSEGIDRLRQRAQELGITIDDEFGRQAQAYQANLRAMRNQGRSLAMSAANDLVPALNDFMSVINDVDTSDAQSDLDDMEDKMGKLERAARVAGAAVLGVATGAEVLGAEVGGAVGNIEQWGRNTFEMWTDADALRGAGRAELPLVGTLQDWLMDDESIEDAEDAFAQIQARRMGGHELGDGAQEIWERRSEDIRRMLDGDFADGSADGDDEPVVSDEDDPALSDDSDLDAANDDYQQWVDDRRQIADQWRQDTRTIFEAHNDDFEELQSLYDDDFIDEETLQRGTDQLASNIEDHFSGVASSWEGGKDELIEQHEEAVDELADAYAEGLIGDDAFADSLDVLSEELNERTEEIQQRQEEEERRRMEDLEERAERVRAQLEGIDLHQQRQLENLEELREEGVITYREYQQAVEMAKDSTEELEESTDRVAQMAEKGLSTLGDMVVDQLVHPFGRGAEEMEQTFSERLDGMVRDFSQAMARMALEEAMQQVISSAVGGAFSDGGEVQAFSTGGFVSGPGTSTSDSIPAALSDGEYVVRADAVNRYGTGFMDAVNSGRLSAFAEGGQVGPSSSAESGGAPPVNVIIVHSEEEVAEMMSGSAGERVVVAHMQKNSGQIA